MILTVSKLLTAKTEYANVFYELRKKKGITPEQAAETIKDPSYYAVMMVKQGDADGMVSGAIHSSADTIRPSLQILKTAPGTKLVSAFFIMNVPNCEYGHNGTFIFGDCGLNQDPTADEVSEIAISSAASYKQLIQDEPRVAMLSYSTYGSAKSALVDKMQEATKLAKEKAPELKLDGELQLDAAIVDNVAKSKAHQTLQAVRMYLFSLTLTQVTSVTNLLKDLLRPKLTDLFFKVSQSL